MPECKLLALTCILAIVVWLLAILLAAAVPMLCRPFPPSEGRFDIFREHVGVSRARPKLVVARAQSSYPFSQMKLLQARDGDHSVSNLRPEPSLRSIEVPSPRRLLR